WQNIQHFDLKKLPLSGFPCFSFDLGKTTYTHFDLAGKATAGEQEFVVTAYYTLPLRGIDNAYLNHSDMTNIIERFLNDPLYIPPSVSPGESYRIERTMITTTKAPVLMLGDTRFVVSVSGKYVFTLF
ncbi:MAG: hypothetical protein Q8896_14605, partial [Bacteroidota bacterium]|nr:hypothetical protein [Bacteroidota bacterium]